MVSDLNVAGRTRAALIHMYLGRGGCFPEDKEKLCRNFEILISERKPSLQYQESTF